MLAAPVSLSSGAAVDGIDASLELGGRITGSVALPDGTLPSMMSGVGVYAIPAYGGAGGGFASVDPATGSYTISGLAPGDYRVSFMPRDYFDETTGSFVPKPNLVTEYFNGTTDYTKAATVSVQTGVTTTGIDASLDIGGVITGTVTLPGALSSLAFDSIYVSAHSYHGMGGSGSATVDPETGTYTISGLPSGAYRIAFSASDPSLNLVAEYYNETYDYNSAAVVEATAGQTVAGINAALEEGASIKGTVKLPSGLPASAAMGVRVVAESAVGTGSTYLWGSIDPTNGSYTIDRLPAGTYQVSFEGISGWDPANGASIPAANVVSSYYNGASTPADSTAITLVAGQTRSGIDASLAKGATISGTATFPAGTEYAYLSVVSSATGERMPVGSEVDLATGDFAIERLAAGKYYVYAFAAQALPGGEYRFGSQFLRSSESKFGVTVSAAGTATMNTKAGNNSGVITGAITASGFAGSATEDTYLGDTVVYQKLDAGWMALPEAVRGSTSVNGSTPYTIPGLAAGTYTVGFEKSQTPYSAATSVVPEWWQRKASLADSNAFTLADGQTRAGIDGTVRATTVAPLTDFTDVSSTPGSPTYSQFADEIAWMAQRGISTGYDIGGAKEYRPFGTVTRDAMAAFLYRAAGSPAYTAPATSPFVDVSPASPFYKEITWLAEQRVSTGWDISGGKKEFRPFSNITRDAMAAFLYRFAEEPEVTLPSSSPFIDVPASGSFYKEISWLAQQEISTGWPAAGGKKEFRPFNAITRDAMAAFLYRYSNLY